tara:strand:+ start:66 stop:395 length:330 start_codon:yes stop_codon:yes gene_type:complete
MRLLVRAGISTKYSAVARIHGRVTVWGINFEVHASISEKLEMIMMQVGDLVELSAQGKKSEWLKSLVGCHGIVVSTHGTRYKIQWFGGNSRNNEAPHHTITRRCLKYLK